MYRNKKGGLLPVFHENVLKVGSMVFEFEANSLKQHFYSLKIIAKHFNLFPIHN